MTTILSESRIADKMQIVMIPIMLINNVVLLAYHTYKVMKRNKDPNMPKKENNMTQNLSIISLSSICIYTLYLIIVDGFYNEFRINYVSCTIVVDISLVLFGNSRFIVYFLFFQRLVDIFNNSAFSFQESTVKTSYIVLTIAYIICFVYVIVFGEGIYSEINDSCSANFTWWFIMIFSLFDVFICTLLQVLFARKLLNVIKLNEHSGRQNAYSRMILALNKSTVLAFIAIFTNESAMVLTAIFLLPSVWTAINSVVNCWCIILIFSMHSKLYDIICVGFRKPVSIKCLYCFACNCCCKINKMEYQLQKTDIENVPE